MPRLLPLVCLAALVLPAGLAAQDTTRKDPRPRRNPDLISEQEVQAAPDASTTALDLVRQLRPSWLRQRGAGSIRLTTPPAQVYVGGVRRGGPGALQDVPRASIREIQHLNGADATMHYGMGHESGAILVILK